MELKNKQVYYIQSQTMNSMLIRMILTKNGVKLTCDYWDTERTLARMATYMPIDLILLDLTMSNEANGYDICEIIHNDPLFSVIPVVATAQLNPVLGIQKARAKGFFGYIGAPLNATLFPQQMSSLLEGKPVWYGI